MIKRIKISDFRSIENMDTEFALLTVPYRSTAKLSYKSQSIIHGFFIKF